MSQRNLVVGSKLDLDNRWLAPSYFVVILLVFFASAHNVNLAPGLGALLLPVYWLVRLSAEFVLFVGTLFILESTLLQTQLFSQKPMRWPFLAVASCLVTIVPFVMIVTMLDIAMGLPELGGTVLNTENTWILKKLALETLYLTDNHIVFCILVIFPRVLIESYGMRESSGLNDAEFEIFPAFMAHVKPPISGDLECIEAQEHYIKIRTDAGTGMALYRFRDALGELKSYPGLQVHRSYWVADKAVKSVEKHNRSIRLELTNGEIIPVSRRFEIAVLERFPFRETE